MMAMVLSAGLLGLGVSGMHAANAAKLANAANPANVAMAGERKPPVQQVNDDEDDSPASNDFADADKSARADPLRSLLRQASSARVFSLPSATELAAVEQLFAQLLAGSSDPQSAKMQASASALGLDLKSVNGFTVLMEKMDARRGRGFFAFRQAGMNKSLDVLQVPHSFKDEMTRDIGLGLFAEGRFAAVAFNTVPRRFNDDNGQEVVADMAHITGTYFLALTQATAKVLGRGRTLQIHGFEQGKRKSALLADSDIILSAGHAGPPASLRQSRELLQQRLQRNVVLYGEGIKELGATTNVEAAALRALGYDNFIHVEMSRTMRAIMRDDAGARKQLLSSILAGGA
jgi:hypothetical protein